MSFPATVIPARHARHEGVRPYVGISEFWLVEHLEWLRWSQQDAKSADRGRCQHRRDASVARCGSVTSGHGHKPVIARSSLLSHGE